MKTVNRFADVLNKNLALLSVLCALFALMVPSFWTNLAGSVNLDLSWRMPTRHWQTIIWRKTT